MEEDKEMCKVAMDNTMFLTSMLRSKRITEQNETVQDFSKDNSSKIWAKIYIDELNIYWQIVVLL